MITGEEGFQEGLELREQNKMLPDDVSKSKRKRGLLIIFFNKIKLFLTHFLFY